MLDGIKIDRESTIQSCLAAKRIQRRELELMTELMKRDKYGPRLSALDASIKGLEGTIADRTDQDAKRKAVLCSRKETTPAGMTFSPTREGANPAYRTTSRSQMERVPAYCLTRRDDVMLELSTDTASGLRQTMSTVVPGGRKTITGDDVDDDYVPSVEEVNEEPWTTRATHSGLMRDPYMRKYNLHRYNTYLHSDQMKKRIANTKTDALVKKDGCDFNSHMFIKSQKPR